jgi:hypothetical protein
MATLADRAGTEIKTQKWKIKYFNLFSFGVSAAWS